VPASLDLQGHGVRRAAGPGIPTRAVRPRGRPIVSVLAGVRGATAVPPGRGAAGDDLARGVGRVLAGVPRLEGFGITALEAVAAGTRGLEAVQQLKEEKSIDQPATVRFPDEATLTEVFNERTYRLLRVIRDEAPAIIRETARLVGHDKKNVHKELTTLEGLGVIRFVADGQARRPVFPYDELVVTPLADGIDDGAPATP